MSRKQGMILSSLNSASRRALKYLSCIKINTAEDLLSAAMTDFWEYTLRNYCNKHDILYSVDNMIKESSLKLPDFVPKQRTTVRMTRHNR